MPSGVVRIVKMPGKEDRAQIYLRLRPSYHISQLTNLCKTLAAAILLTSSTHFGAPLGAFFY